MCGGFYPSLLVGGGRLEWVVTKYYDPNHPQDVFVPQWKEGVLRKYPMVFRSHKDWCIPGE